LYINHRQQEPIGITYIIPPRWTLWVYDYYPLYVYGCPWHRGLFIYFFI